MYFHWAPTRLLDTNSQLTLPFMRQASEEISMMRRVVGSIGFGMEQSERAETRKQIATQGMR